MQGKDIKRPSFLTVLTHAVQAIKLQEALAAPASREYDTSIALPGGWKLLLLSFATLSAFSTAVFLQIAGNIFSSAFFYYNRTHRAGKTTFFIPLPGLDSFIYTKIFLTEAKCIT